MRNTIIKQQCSKTKTKRRKGHQIKKNTPTRSVKSAEEADNYNPADDIRVGNTTTVTKKVTK